MARPPRHPGTPRQLSWSGLGWVALATPALLIAAAVAALVALPLALLGALTAPKALRHARRVRIESLPFPSGATLDPIGRYTADVPQR